MAVFKYTKEFFLKPGEKLDPGKNKFHVKLTPATKLDDEFLVKRTISIDKQRKVQE